MTLFLHLYPLKHVCVYIDQTGGAAAAGQAKRTAILARSVRSSRMLLRSHQLLEATFYLPSIGERSQSASRQACFNYAGSALHLDLMSK